VNHAIIQNKIPFTVSKLQSLLNVTKVKRKSCLTVRYNTFFGWDRNLTSTLLTLTKMVMNLRGGRSNSPITCPGLGRGEGAQVGDIMNREEKSLAVVMPVTHMQDEVD
jgi:hypothetical protein